MYSSENHTFVVCAYKESEYLSACIESLMNQRASGSKIKIATSTPNDHIREIASKYGLELCVNDGAGGIANDWNYAYSCADTQLVTLAHQDDIYKENYLEDALAMLNQAKHPLIYFCDYHELRDGEETSKNTLLRIKRILVSPMRIKAFRGSRFWKRRILCLGNPICCPSVTYVRDNLPKPPKKLFRQHYRSDVDWETWEKLSRCKGDFMYQRKAGMCHRIHGNSETSATIQDNVRITEDNEMFAKFWPGFIAKRLTRFYANSEKSNKI